MSDDSIVKRSVSQKSRKLTSVLLGELGRHWCKDEEREQERSKLMLHSGTKKKRC